MGSITRFYIRAAGGERIETVVKAGAEERGMAFGRIVDEAGKPLRDVCVMLMDTLGKQDFADFVPLDSIFTDEDGCFMLGPLEDGALYAVCVYRGGGKMRRLELKL